MWRTICWGLGLALWYQAYAILNADVFQRRDLSQLVNGQRDDGAWLVCSIIGFGLLFLPMMWAPSTAEIRHEAAVLQARGQIGQYGKMLAAMVLIVGGLWYVGVL